MYLSKVKLNWTQAKNPYEQHRALWMLFPDRPQDQRNFLFRVEQLEDGQGASVLMQSQSAPQACDSVDLLALREWETNFQVGQPLRFRLRANPVKAVKDASKGEVQKNGKTYARTARVPLIKEEQQHAWLERKLSGAAELKSLIIQSEFPLNFRKNREQRSGKIQTVLFDGILEVTSVDAFELLMMQGVGPAKSFGCGLLSLAPA